MTDYILGFKITADGNCSHEIKRCLLLGTKVMTNLDSTLKSRDITLSTKGMTEDEMVGQHHLLEWTGVWSGSGSWWWTGKPDVLQSIGSQRVGHDWVTELSWTELVLSKHYNLGCARDRGKPWVTWAICGWLLFHKGGIGDGKSTPWPRHQWQWRLTEKVNTPLSVRKIHVSMNDLKLGTSVSYHPNKDTL